jgi:hypothetical protein
MNNRAFAIDLILSLSDHEGNQIRSIGVYQIFNSGLSFDVIKKSTHLANGLSLRGHFLYKTGIK